jgi:uncharacterized protein YjdB
MVRTTEGRGKRDLFLSLSIAGALLLVSCEYSVIELDQVKESSRISIDQRALEFVAIGDTAELRVTRAAGQDAPNEVQVYWSSLDPKVARVAPTGRVVSTGPGTTSIIATARCCGSDTISVRVQQVPDRILIFARDDVFAVGDTARFTAIAYDRNDVAIADAGVIWEISHPDVARVDAAGVLTALSHGSADVIAAVASPSAGVAADDHSGKGTKGGPGGPGSKPIKVRNSGSLAVQPLEVTLTALEATAQLDARLIDETGTTSEVEVKWRSLDQKVASVDGNGVVESIARGSARVIASAKCCGADTVVVQVEPRVAEIEILNCPGSLEPGKKVRLEAEATDYNGYSVADATIRWSTSDTAVASVADDGTVTANAVGSVSITASADAAARTVSMEIQGTEAVEPGTLRLRIIPSLHRFTAIGAEAQLRVIGITEAGDTISDPGVDWSSSNRKVVEVDAMGRIFSRGAGTAVITAACTLCVSATMSASVSLAQAANARYPNEPAGFVPWFMHDWQSFPDGEECVVPASGLGYFIFCGVSAHVGRAKLIDDPDAPHGFGKSLRVHWPAGMSVGHGVFNYAIRSTPHRTNPERLETSAPLQKWYVSTWVYLEPEADGTWEAHFNQLRHFSMNRHITGTGKSSATWAFRGMLPYEGSKLVWDGNQRQTETRDYRLSGRECPDCSTTTQTTVQPGPRLGQWVHMELLFDRTVKAAPLFALGDDGVGPVHVRYWENGKLMMDRVIDDAYMSHPFMELFFNLNQSGGIAPGTHKYIRLSGTYVSGELYEGS